MKANHKYSPLVIGLALFAMFFGSGNLIYPLYVGVENQGAWPLASIGFIITAVLLPVLGVLGMIKHKGCYRTFFSSIGRKGGFLLAALLLTVWIPLGSGPRCITLAYASLSSYFPNLPSLWVFSLIYSALVFAVIHRSLGVIQVLGKYITPLLLACIALIAYQGLFGHLTLEIGAASVEPFFHGLSEGYNTMDLIASFFFSASVIHILSSSGEETSHVLKIYLRGACIAVLILGVVYTLLMATAGSHSAVLQGVPKDQILAYLSQILLGPQLSIIAILLIVLACFSTSVALIITYDDFLKEEVFHNQNNHYVSTICALALSFVMSLFGLSGITAVTAPVLKVSYPVLILLILYALVRPYFSKNKELELEKIPVRSDERDRG